MLQVQAIDRIARTPLNDSPQSSFRVSTFRMEMNLDERPSSDYNPAVS